MIPAHIAKADIVKAIRRIDLDGVPPQRKARGYCLVVNGRHFHPKYTITLAHEIATGESLSPGLFSGGVESNDFLCRRGFNVVECGCRGSVKDD